MVVKIFLLAAFSLFLSIALFFVLPLTADRGIGWMRKVDNSVDQGSKNIQIRTQYKPNKQIMETQLQVIEQIDSNVEIEPILDHMNTVFQTQIQLFEEELSSRGKALEHEPLKVTHTYYSTSFDIGIVSSYGEATLQLDQPCIWKMNTISFYHEHGKELNKISETYGCDILLPELENISSSGDEYILTFNNGGTLSFKDPDRSK